MFEHETVTQIIFRILNFGVLIGLLGYLLRVYGLPLIRTQMDEVKRQRKAMEELERALAYQKEELDHHIAADSQLVQTLEKKVAQWALFIESQQSKHAAKKDAIAHALAQKNVRKEEHLLMLKAKKNIVPRALVDAHQELLEYFSKKETGGEYVHQMINALKERGD